MEQIILPKNIFLPHFEIVQNFHYFVRSVPVDFPPKFNFPKTGSNVIEMFLLMIGTNSFAKYISLPHFEIVQNFHFFVRSTSVDFLSKIQFSENCLQYCRKNKIFTILPVDFLSKIQFSKNSNVVEMFLLMSGTNNFAKKYFLTPF